MKKNLFKLKTFALNQKELMAINGGGEVYVCTHPSSDEKSYHNKYEADQLVELGCTCSFVLNIKLDIKK